MDKFQNLDAAESIFFEQELEAVKSKTYDRQFPALMARTLIPMATDVNPGAETIKYRAYDSVGMAKIISNYAHDLPRADVKGIEGTSHVRSIGDSYGYNVQEIRAARMAGIPLETRRANAAKQAAMELENRLAFFGDAGYGINGLLNAPNITEVVLPADGAGGSKLWSTKTPTQILRDLFAVANAPSELTNMVEQPDTLLLSVSKFNLINSMARNDMSETTVLQYFLKNSTNIKSVQPVNEMKGAFGGQDAIFVYSRDPDKLEMQVPQDFEQFPAQERGLEFIVPCHMRFGGVTVYYPLSVAFGKGI